MSSIATDMSHSLCIRSPAATAHGANASQQEYLVQKDLEPETDNATRTTPRSRTFFLDLPAEVRNEIYHLALFHFETNGIISPSVHSKWPSVTLVEGVRIMILEGYVTIPISLHLIPGEEIQTSTAHATHPLTVNPSSPSTIPSTSRPPPTPAQTTSALQNASSNPI